MQAPIVLNPGQEAAAEKLFQFLISDEKEFILAGPPGTGKTMMMHKVIREVANEADRIRQLLRLPQISYTVQLTATTNKATEVLKVATGLPTKTIHSYLNLKVTNNYQTGKTTLSRTNNWTVHTRTLLFIDEASMIDKDLHKHIKEGTDSTCKIIYIGDPSQLAPVFETISPVFMHEKPFAVLTQQMRNAGQPALMALCDQLRESVATGILHPIEEVPGVIDYVDDAGAEAFIKETFKEENPDSRVLCYSNSKVQDYNHYIRQELRGYPHHFVSGETVICNNGVQASGYFMSVEEEFEVQGFQPPEKVVFDTEDENGWFSGYKVTLLARDYSRITATIPEDPDHFNLLVRHYSNKQKWPIYFKLKGYPDLRPRDAATVYKAQGSTYDTVLMDLANIGKCTNTDQVLRMLYVGASRPKSRLILYGKLPSRFFNANKT